MNTENFKLNYKNIEKYIVYIILSIIIIKIFYAYQPSSSLVNTLNDDSSVPVMMSNEIKFKFFDVFFWAQDRFGSFPFILLHIIKLVTSIKVTPNILYIFSILTFIFSSVLIFKNENLIKSSLLLSILLFTFSVDEVSSQYFFGLEFVSIWQIPYLFLTYYFAKPEIIITKYGLKIKENVIYIIILFIISSIATWIHPISACIIFLLILIKFFIKSELTIKLKQVYFCLLYSFINTIFSISCYFIIVNIYREKFGSLTRMQIVSSLETFYKDGIITGLSYIFSWHPFFLITIYISLSAFLLILLYSLIKRKFEYLRKFEYSYIFLCLSIGILISCSLSAHAVSNGMHAKYIVISKLSLLSFSFIFIFEFFSFLLKFKYITLFLFIIILSIFINYIPKYISNKDFIILRSIADNLSLNYPNYPMLGSFYCAYAVYALQVNNNIHPIALFQPGSIQTIRIPGNNLEYLNKSKYAIVCLFGLKFSEPEFFTNKGKLKSEIIQYGHILKLHDDKYFKNLNIPFAVYEIISKN